MQYGSCHGNTGEAPCLCTKMKKEMANSRCALSNQNIVEKLEENVKNKTIHTWLNVWQTWVIERKKLKNTSMNNSQSNRRPRLSNFVEYMILNIYFGIYGHL